MRKQKRKIRALDADSCWRAFFLFFSFFRYFAALSLMQSPSFCFLFAQNFIKCVVCECKCVCVYFRLYILYSYGTFQAVTFNLPYYSNKIYPVHWPAASKSRKLQHTSIDTHTHALKYNCKV